MKKISKLAALCSMAALMSACATTPMGPTVRAMPPGGKPFDQFAQEQAYCKEYATTQVQGQADAANTNGLLYGVGGTVLGAGLGAALGGGSGAAIGAGAGALGGSAVGASSSGGKQRGIQDQYNDAYAACMTSKGNKIEPRVVYTQPQTTVIYTQPAPPPTVIYAVPPPPPRYVPLD
jgi:outer membrane lipoprotein SlyB